MLGVLQGQQGTELGVFVLLPSSCCCFSDSFSLCPPWFLGTTGIRAGKARDSVRAFPDLWWFCCIPLGLVRLRTGQRRVEEKEEKQNGLWDKGKKLQSCSSLWSVRRSICLFESEAESLFKMHQMFECEARSWQHLWFSVETSHRFPRRCLYSHEKGLIQRPSRSGTVRSWSRQVVSARSCEVSAARPHKIRAGRARGFQFQPAAVLSSLSLSSAPKDDRKRGRTKQASPSLCKSWCRWNLWTV